MDFDIKSMNENQVWYLYPLDISTIFIKKMSGDVQVDTFKTQLVVEGKVLIIRKHLYHLP